MSQVKMFFFKWAVQDYKKGFAFFVHVLHGLYLIFQLDPMHLILDNPISIGPQICLFWPS